MQHARAVHALDTIELDVRCRRRPGHERERPASLDRCLELSDRLRNQSHDLILPNDADVKVRHERQSPPALPLAAIENERPDLGDAERAGGESAVEAVELGH